MSAFMCSEKLIRRVACCVDDRFDQERRAIIFKWLWDLNREAIQVRYGDKAANEIGESPAWVETWDSIPQGGSHPLSTTQEKEKIVRLLKACECFAYQCSESKELEDKLKICGVTDVIQNLRYQLLNTIPEYASAGWDC